MKQPAILILGAGIMQLPAYEAARKNNWFSIGVDGNPNAPCKSRADLFLNIDLKDRTGLVEASLNLIKTKDIKGVFTCGTDFSASVAWIAEKLNLPGIPYQTALDCTDKFRMRMKFRESGIPCPDFCEVSEEMDSHRETGKMKYPLVVKPVDSMGGRGVITVETPEVLDRAVKEAIGFSRTRRAIVEEFMDGKEYSIDSLVYGDSIYITGFADRHIYYPPCFIEMGHTIPSDADSETEQEIYRVFKSAVKALGISIGAAKGDIKVTSKGVMIGEIAARLSGGYMSGWTFPYSSGIHLVEEGMRIAMGFEPGDLKPSIKEFSSERAFISIPGKIVNIKNLDEAHNMEFVRDIFLLADIGDRVKFPLNNVMKCGNIISVSSNRNNAVESSSKAASMIRMILEPGDEETCDFLSEPLNVKFPPSAYSPDQWAEFSVLEKFKPDFSMKYKESPIPLPEKEISALVNQLDWNCIKLSDALEEIIKTKNLKISEKNNWTLFALHFWYALLRGGIQGALWYIENNDGAL